MYSYYHIPISAAAFPATQLNGETWCKYQHRDDVYLLILGKYIVWDLPSQGGILSALDSKATAFLC